MVEGLDSAADDSGSCSLPESLLPEGNVFCAELSVCWAVPSSLAEVDGLGEAAGLVMVSSKTRASAIQARRHGLAKPISGSAYPYASSTFTTITLYPTNRRCGPPVRQVLYHCKFLQFMHYFNANFPAAGTRSPSPLTNYEFYSPVQHLEQLKDKDVSVA